jgi:hypothetical protein
MKNNEGNASPKFERNYYRHDHKKQTVIKSPDIQKLQEVKIDERTKLYIALDADPEEARSRYFNRLEAKSNMHYSVKKPVTSTSQVKVN